MLPHSKTLARCSMTPSLMPATEYLNRFKTISGSEVVPEFAGASLPENGPVDVYSLHEAMPNQEILQSDALSPSRKNVLGCFLD
jgi:hypothetical protein